MKFYLIVAKGKHKGMPIPIAVDLFYIGSEKICQLRSSKPGVGTQHCALNTRHKKVFVRDLDSGFPTLLNGELVPPGEEWPCHAGDLLEIGPLDFMIQMHERALSQRDLEEWAAKCLDVTEDRELFDEDADYFHRATNASEAAAGIIDHLQAQRGLVMGRLRIGKVDGITTVRFNDLHLVDEGEIALIRKELSDYLSNPNMRILLDCKNIRRLSTTAVHMLSEMYRWFRSKGSSVALCRIQPELQGIIHTMIPHIPYYPDKQRAIESSW